MAWKKSGTGRSGVSGWGALLLGLGGVLPSGEQASAASNFNMTDVVSLRAEGDKIYLSQGGSPFEELSLGETPEALQLRKLLGDTGSAGISAPVDSFIVANGGSGVPGNKPNAAESTSKVKKKPAHKSSKRNVRS